MSVVKQRAMGSRRRLLNRARWVTAGGGLFVALWLLSHDWIASLQLAVLVTGFSWLVRWAMRTQRRLIAVERAIRAQGVGNRVEIRPQGLDGIRAEIRSASTKTSQEIERANTTLSLVGIEISELLSRTSAFAAGVVPDPDWDEGADPRVRQSEK